MIRAVLVIGLLFLFLPCSAERTVGLIVVGMILCEVYSAVMQTVLFRRNLGPIHSLRGEGEELSGLRRKMIAIAVPVGSTALLGNLLGSANSVLIPRLLMDGGMNLQEAMSAFGVTFGMTLPMLMLPTALLGGLNLILSPKLAEASALGNRELIKGRIRRAGTAANLILIPSMALLMVLGPRLGNYLYQDVRVAGHMELLAIGELFSCWQMLLCNALSGLNFQASAAKITLFSDAIQLGVTFFTVGRPEIGLKGFTWAYVAGAVIGAFLSLRKLSRETGFHLPAFDCFVAPVLAAALSALLTRLLYLVLLREPMGEPLAGSVAFLFGALLYLVTLQAQGVYLRRLRKGETLAPEKKNR